jgi:hypothetical protein
MPKSPPPVGRRPRRFRLFWLIVLLVPVFGAGAALLFRQGLVPAALNPLPHSILASPTPGLFDWRLRRAQA